MIRLGTMTSVCPDWSIEQIIDGMQRHGFEGLEPRAGWGHASGFELDMPAAARDAARAKMEDAGLKISCVATGAKFAAEDPADLDQSIAEANAAIDLAADLGAGLIRTFGGTRGKGEVFWMVNRTAEAYKRVMDHAAERGVIVMMETHDEWCVSTQVRAVVEKVNHPNLGVLWDLMHTQRYMERPEETMQTIGALAKHLHAHDGRYDTANGKITTVGLGEGDLDYVTPLKLLHDAGFDGFFSVEVIHKSGSDHDADATLKAYGDGFRKIVENF